MVKSSSNGRAVMKQARGKRAEIAAAAGRMAAKYHQQQGRLSATTKRSIVLQVGKLKAMMNRPKPRIVN